jgi:hypothetical protein
VGCVVSGVVQRLSSLLSCLQPKKKKKKKLDFYFACSRNVGDVITTLENCFSCILFLFCSGKVTMDEGLVTTLEKCCSCFPFFILVPISLS